MKNIRKIFALLCVIGLLALYVVTFIAGVSGKASKELLMACIVRTVLIPGILYGMMIFAKLFDKKDE